MLSKQLYSNSPASCHFVCESTPPVWDISASCFSVRGSLGLSFKSTNTLSKQRKLVLDCGGSRKLPALLAAQLPGRGDGGMESVALYSFQATESDELAFNKGDTLKVGWPGLAELCLCDMGGCLKSGPGWPF